jgi:type IV pilus assembly protein PilA
LQSATPNCSVIAVAAPEASGKADEALSCTIKGNPRVAGKKVVYSRTSAGAWICKSDTEATFYKPAGCVSI